MNPISRSHPVMVATSVAARGLDIVGVTHVINYDMPDDVSFWIPFWLSSTLKILKFYRNAFPHLTIISLFGSLAIPFSDRRVRPPYRTNREGGKHRYFHILLRAGTGCRLGTRSCEDPLERSTGQFTDRERREPPAPLPSGEELLLGDTRLIKTLF